MKVAPSKSARFWQALPCTFPSLSKCSSHTTAQCSFDTWTSGQNYALLHGLQAGHNLHKVGPLRYIGIHAPQGQILQSAWHVGGEVRECRIDFKVAISLGFLKWRSAWAQLTHDHSKWKNVRGFSCMPIGGHLVSNNKTITGCVRRGREQCKEVKNGEPCYQAELQQGYHWQKCRWQCPGIMDCRHTVFVATGPVSFEAIVGILPSKLHVMGLNTSTITNIWKSPGSTRKHCVYPFFHVWK